MDAINFQELIVPCLIVFVLTAAIASLIFWLIDKKKIANGTSKVKLAEEEAIKIIEEAKKSANDILKQAEAEKKEKVILAKEEIQKERAEADKENKERRAEIQKQERRLLQKEESLDRKIENLEKKELQVAEKIRELENEQQELDNFKEKQIAELEKIAGMSQDEAKKHLLAILSESLTHESALMIKENENKIKEEAQKKAKELITYAVQ